MSVGTIQQTVTEGGRRFSERFKRIGGTEPNVRPFSESDPWRELSKDQAFDVLRNSRRRAVISALRRSGGSLSLEALTTRVAADEYGIPSDELSSDQYKRVYTGLYQCHLGRMGELGVIDFEKESKTIRLCKAASELDPYLQDGRDLESASIELGVASAVAFVVTSGLAGLGPFGSTSVTALAALTVAALFGLALFHTVDRGPLSAR